MRRNYVSGEVAKRTLGVSDSTLRRWADSGSIDCIRVEGTGHRRYDVDGLLEREQKRLADKRAKLSASR